MTYLEPDMLTTSTHAIPGVNIAGYVNGEFGLGEGVRATIRAIETTGIPFAINNCSFTVHRKLDSSYQDFSETNPYPINLIQVSFDLISIFINSVNPDYLKNRYNIGFWAWELQDFPQEAQPAFNLFNEIWTYSNYCVESIAKASPIPVIKIMPCLALKVPSLNREALGLPTNKFIFLFVFDLCSGLERKNPQGVIQAFKQAFAQRNQDVLLVIKFSNSEHFPKEKEQIKVLVDGEPSIKIIDGYLLKEELNALIYHCNCYISLHRAEGFGLTMAEAMYYGKPVIATAFSANTEYMNVGNSFLVKYDFVPVAEDYGFYRKGSLWANPDIHHAAYLMQYVFDNYTEAKRVGERAAYDIQSFLNPQTIGRKIRSRLEYIGQMTNNFTNLPTLEQVQAQLVRSESQLHQLQAVLENHQSQLQQTQVNLAQSQQRIKAMESSKFWQLRTNWFRLKRLMGIPGEE